jgi:GMP synthase-like glutamine amidotransferase
MSSAVILQHVEYASPGRIVPVFRDFGIPVDLRRLHNGDEVPTDLDEIRVLVVLGGPMSVADVGSAKYPFLQQEVDVLKRMIGADRTVLGIALGAQLLAHAAGAKVYPNVKPGAKPEDPATPMPEYGWGPVQFPFPGGTEPIVFGLSDGVPMFHWHADTFDLPKLPAPAGANPAPPGAPPPPTGSVLLSSSRTCKNQAFRFKTRLFGFQYHFEFSEADVEALLANDGEALARAAGGDAVARIREETPRVYPRYARLGDRILENFVQYLKAY